MQEINSYILKITGGAELSQKIYTDLVLKIKDAELSCFSKTIKDNQDGTFDCVYTCRITSGIEFEQGGEIIRGADKTSQSKKTRYAIKMLAYDLGETETDSFYEIFQQKLRSNIRDVWFMLKNK